MELVFSGFFLIFFPQTPQLWSWNAACFIFERRDNRSSSSVKRTHHNDTPRKLKWNLLTDNKTLPVFPTLSPQQSWTPLYLQYHY